MALRSHGSVVECLGALVRPFALGVLKATAARRSKGLCGGFALKWGGGVSDTCANDRNVTKTENDCSWIGRLAMRPIVATWEPMAYKRAIRTRIQGNSTQPALCAALCAALAALRKRDVANFSSDHHISAR